MVIVLVAGMLVTGCLNTLLLKYQDQTCDAVDATRPTGCASFPVLQSLMMFAGESLCFLVIGAMKLRRYVSHRQNLRKRPLLVGATRVGTYSPLAGVESDDDYDDREGEENILSAALQKPADNPELHGLATLYLSLPAICDILGTTTMSVGLLLVPASIFQMCRGSLVLFVGLFSVVFLGRRLVRYQWLSLVLVTVGVFMVGLSSVLYQEVAPGEPQGTPDQASDTPDLAARGLLGIGLITGAQLFTASQFVIEEWILSRYSIEPLKVAGLEGLFGTIISACAIVVAHYSYGSTARGSNGTFDVEAGLSTILGNQNIWLAFLLFSLSIASFNFFGLSVTQTVSATSRSTIDTCRTLFIWTISMALGWEHFKLLQLIGFTVLVYATLVFNGVIRPPAILESRDRIEVPDVREHTLE